MVIHFVITFPDDDYMMYRGTTNLQSNYLQLQITFHKYHNCSRSTPKWARNPNQAATVLHWYNFTDQSNLPSFHLKKYMYTY